MRVKILLLCLALIAATQLYAQFGGRRFSGRSSYPPTFDRGNVPTWPVAQGFTNDCFTFVRIKYSSSRPERSSYAWFTDWPDADLNMSYRLQELTSIRVNPDPKVVELTDPELLSYPWTIMSGAGNISLMDREAHALRNYLLNGGFLMIDDFWGQAEWDGVYHALKKTFPEFEPMDIPRSHPIFHSVFDIPDSLSLQTPNVSQAVRNRDNGETWEDRHEGGNTREVHYRGIFDKNDRLMVMICHNTDTSDGWEEEGTDPWFFTNFAEKKCYPLGINIIFYAMTH